MSGGRLLPDRAEPPSDNREKSERWPRERQGRKRTKKGAKKNKTLLRSFLWQKQVRYATPLLLIHRLSTLYPPLFSYCRLRKIYLRYTQDKAGCFFGMLMVTREVKVRNNQNDKGRKYVKKHIYDAKMQKNTHNWRFFCLKGCRFEKKVVPLHHILDLKDNESNL